MSDARRLAAAAGLTVPQVARRARIGAAYFARLARHGNAPAHLAERLAHVLGCSPQVFLWGLSAYDASKGAIGTTPATPEASVTLTAQGAANLPLRRRASPALQLIGDRP